MTGFVRVAKLSEVPPGKMLAVRVEGEDVVLYNVGGSVFASRDFCPHAGYALSQSAFREKYVRCSLHGWEFDVRTGEYTGNPYIRLRCYGVRIEGEDVWISLEPVRRPDPPPVSRDEA
jgi:nitrite reductase/ring-hydroxylating ferredoxin subunit